MLLIFKLIPCYMLYRYCVFWKEIQWTHHKIKLYCQNLSYLIKKTLGQGKDESHQFNSEMACNTKAIFSMALICWQSWTQLMNDAVGEVFAPFIFLCSSQHNNRWRTQPSKARLQQHNGTITYRWCIGLVQAIQTLQLTDNIGKKGSQN